MSSVMSSLGITSSSSSTTTPSGMTNIPRTLAPLTNWNLGMAFPEVSVTFNIVLYCTELEIFTYITKHKQY